uniref:Uncharacterized protein n=1 Tax=Physcomitrium patens TaxID=3218 RepID=A0A2K1JBJ2_PHYPA|nr:hypothetical protein PHYPA_019190 [Physcomitrium patens]
MVAVGAIPPTSFVLVLVFSVIVIHGNCSCLHGVLVVVSCSVAVWLRRRRVR